MILMNSKVGPREIIIGLAVLVVVVIIVLIKQKMDEKKGVNSEEKQAVDALVKRLVPPGEIVTPAYACWEWKTYQGRTTTTQYWYYAIGFNNSALYVVPLSFAGGDMSHSDVYCIHKDELGLINADKKSSWMELYNKQNECILSLMVVESNTKDDKYHPVNIQQPDEAKAFMEWRDRWMDEVNTANGVTVSGKIGKPAKGVKKK